MAFIGKKQSEADPFDRPGLLFYRGFPLSNFRGFPYFFLRHLYPIVSCWDRKVTAQNGYGNANNQLEKITFEDGTTWSGADAAIMGATTVGTAANDVMNDSDAFADTLRGLSGDDSLNGYGGNDKIRVATRVRCTRKRPGRPAGRSRQPGDTKMQTGFGF